MLRQTPADISTKSHTSGVRPEIAAVTTTPRGAIMTGMIGRIHHVVIDCPEPALLAEFYSELTGLPVTYRSDDWIVIARNDTSSGIAFQLAPDHQPPRWPDPNHPQQFHLDIMVDDIDDADTEVRHLGARPLPGGDHVYADPAGHPFCLIPRPSWAPPIRTPTRD